MSIEKFIEKWKGGKYRENAKLGYQCVALIKLYTSEVLKIKLGIFGGSAKAGWENKKVTFPTMGWEKIPNNPHDPNQVPEPGDIIFWETGKYGHVAIVTKGYKGQNKITVMEQNAGNGNGDGKGRNAIRLYDYTYTGVSGWYRKKENWQEKFFQEKKEREVLNNQIGSIKKALEII